MTGQGIERFLGFMGGVFTINGTGAAGTPILIRIPFEISMELVKTKDQFKGTYSFKADPLVLQPRPGTTQSPGVFGVFPEGSVTLPQGSRDQNTLLIGQVLTVPSVKKDGTVEVIKFGSGKMTVRLLDLPQKFMVQASAISWTIVPNAVPLRVEMFPSMGAYGLDLGFFSKSSPNYLGDIMLDFNFKNLRFQKIYKEQAKMDYPHNGMTQFIGEIAIAKTESFYSIVDEKGTKFVEQVTEVEEARKILLEHPEIYDQIRMMGDAETQRGVNEDHIEAKFAPMFAEAPVSTPAPEADAMSSKSMIGTEASGRALDGLIYGIEQLIALGKDGYNGCMLVVDGCWVSVEHISKKKQLYIQVAGDKYIPKKSRLGPEHIKKLETLGITKEQGSDDMFSAYFNIASTDISKLAQDVFRVFDEVLRVTKGSKAYLQLSLVNKPTPEYEAVLTQMAKIIPDRKEKKKFFWNW